MNPKNAEICNRIDSLASAKGTNIAQLEREIGFGNGKIGKWKNSPKSPTYDSLAAIASYFDTTVAYLVGETDDPSAGIKKDPILPDGVEDSETAELREIWSSADKNERRDLLEMARMLKNRRKQNG